MDMPLSPQCDTFGKLVEEETLIRYMIPNAMKIEGKEYVVKVLEALLSIINLLLSVVQFPPVFEIARHRRNERVLLVSAPAKNSLQCLWFSTPHQFCFLFNGRRGYVEEKTTAGNFKSRSPLFVIFNASLQLGLKPDHCFQIKTCLMGLVPSNK